MQLTMILVNSWRHFSLQNRLYDVYVEFICLKVVDGKGVKYQTWGLVFKGMRCVELLGGTMVRKL